MRPSYGAPEVEKEGSRTSGVLENYHEGLRNISGVSVLFPGMHAGTFM